MEIKENNACGTTHENTHKGFQPAFQFRFECKEKKIFNNKTTKILLRTSKSSCILLLYWL